MRLVVVGNGVAGVTTARLVVERDPAVTATLFSAERHPYYARPRLIEFLANRATLESMPFYAPDWYAQRNLRVVLGTCVREMRPAAHQIVLAEGQVESYDRLVLATGAHCWTPPIPGKELPGVFTLRTLDDALAIKARLAQTKRVTVLGGGLLGLDTAMALRANDIPVTVVELLPRLLPRQLDEAGAAVLQRLLEQRGVEVITGDSCAALEGAAGVERVSLKSGRVLESTLVIISAGVRANLELAQAAGLACGKGVTVNERLLTSAPDIYAVGDVAEFNQRNWSIIPAALTQARVAAAQLLGDEATTYTDIVPSSTLQVVGVDLTSVGEVNPETPGYREARVSDAAAGVYKKVVAREGKLVGAIWLGDKKGAATISALVARRGEVAANLDALRGAGFTAEALLGAAS